MRTRWACAALCLAVVVSAPSAWAAGPPDAKTLKEAQERLKEGNRLLDAGDYEGARVAFGQSVALVPHGATYRNLGVAELKLHDVAHGLKHLRTAMTSPDLSADRKAIVRKEYTDAFDATGHVAVTTAAGATVTVDGAAVEGTAPFADPVDVEVGHHVFEAKLEGRGAKFEVDAKAGQIARIELFIGAQPSDASAPPAPPPATAALAPPPAPPELPQTPDEGVAGSAPFWNARRVTGVAVAGVGVASIVAGAAFGAASNNAKNEAASLSASAGASGCFGSSISASCSQIGSEYNTENRDHTLSIAFVGAGIAAVAVGGGLFLWPSSSGHASTALAPMVGPGLGGVHFQGSF